jgi:hypothetical protein
MAEPAGQPYRIDHSAALLNKIKVWTERLAHQDRSIQLRFLEAFKAILERLQADPMNWGEPEKTLPERGLIIYHGLYSVLNVYYTVVEEHRTVVLQDIELIHSFSLECGLDENP